MQMSHSSEKNRVILIPWWSIKCIFTFPRLISCIHLKTINDSYIYIYIYIHTYIQYYLTVTLVSDVIVMDTSIEILAVLRYYFKSGLIAVKAAHGIWEVEGNVIISVPTVQN